MVPISLKNIQERKTTVKEREEGKGDRVAFFKKRGTCAVNNWVPPEIILDATCPPPPGQRLRNNQGK